MRPDLFPHPIAFEDARRRVLDAVTPITRTETVDVLDARERVVAAAVTSAVDVPPFDRAAMDGYAVRAADVATATAEAPVPLTCVDRLFTGRMRSRAVGAGECAEIATGAPLPEGADAVVMVERTSREGDIVHVRDAVTQGRNVGRRGGDIAIGQHAARSGDRLTPARLGALAAIGCLRVDVFARPTVAILSTGTELVPPGQPLPPGRVHDVNSLTLRALTTQHGGIPHVHSAVADDVDALVDALERTASSDVILTSGGSSVGRRDLLIDAIRRCGTIDFHGIAIKPGKPTLFGRVGRTPIFGMPGNPTSCLSNAYILFVPFLRQMARLPAWQPTRIQRTLARPIAALPDRHQFHAVRVVEAEVWPAFKSSGDITSLASADGYIEVPAGVRGFEAGDEVTVVVL